MCRDPTVKSAKVGPGGKRRSVIIYVGEKSRGVGNKATPRRSLKGLEGTLLCTVHCTRKSTMLRGSVRGFAISAHGVKEHRVVPSRVAVHKSPFSGH